MMKFRDKELDFDLFDADTAEAYEAAVDAVMEANADHPKGETLSQTIRRQCAIVFNFFDDLFGDGFHKELFGERTNLLECTDAFAEFTAAVDAQKAQLDERISKTTPNRATRRAAAVGGRK